MKKVYIILLLSSIFLYTGAQSYDASIKFYIDNVSGTVEGSFEGFEASINFQPDNPDDSKIRASVDVSTINTGINLRDNHLQAKNFFWEEEHPEIIMELKDIEKKDEGNYTGIFDLTIKGNTGTVEFPFSYTQLGNTSQFKGQFTINRVDYDVGNKALLYGEEVKVEIEVKVME